MRPNEHRKQYDIFLALLRDARLAAGVSQQELASRLGKTQTFVSKCERGERRLDVIDLLAYMNGIDHAPATFVAELSDVIDKAATASALAALSSLRPKGAMPNTPAAGRKRQRKA